MENPAALNRDLTKMLSGRISEVKVEFDGYCVDCYKEMLN